MRLIIAALAITLASTMPVWSGGGTVTSTEPGPETLTEETTAEMLETMGIQPATAATVEYIAPARPAVTYTAPPRKAVAYVIPPRQVAKTPPEEASDEDIKVTEVAAADPPTPRETVRQCTTCHGLNGLATIPTAPNMAGSSRAYLETQLKAFRSGRRDHEVMSVIAEGLSDEEITAAAKWYSAIKVTAEIPE